MLKRVLVPVTAAILIFTFLLSCSSGSSDEKPLKITAGATQLELTAQSLKSFSTIDIKTTSISSTGEVTESNVTGYPLSDILEANKLSLEGISSLRALASDGYEIDVPADILSKRQILLATVIDGKTVDGDSGMRLCVPEERAMYWVKSLVSITLLKEQVADSGTPATTKRLYFAHTIIPTLTVTSYDEDGDDAVALSDLLKACGLSAGELTITAADDLSVQKSQGFAEGALIRITGENTPYIGSPEFSKGMNVKQASVISSGDTSIVFCVGTLNEASLSDFLAQYDMTVGAECVLSHTDQTVTIKTEGAVILYKDGEVTISADGQVYKGIRMLEGA